MKNKIAQTFCELVQIPSPSGREKQVMKYIQNYLEKIGAKYYFDNAGKYTKGNTGNLISKIGAGKPKIMFVAHVDTVEDGKKKIKPVSRKGIIKSDGTTILGSDDKGAVAALLEAAKELAKTPNLPAIYCVFAVSEEAGEMGVKYLSLKENPEFVFDIDGSDTPGKFISKALGYLNFDLQIIGKEAHAASHPETGANAIKAAGIIISKLKLGRETTGATLNIGRISGGSAMNVIPGEALLQGELRGFTIQQMNSKIKEIEHVARAACKQTGCKHKLNKKNATFTPPFITQNNSKIITLAKKAAKKAGIKFSLKTLNATIQANLLAQQNYSVLGMTKGGQNPHSKKETITTKELEQTKKLIIEIVKNAK
jgi:tripeptide aminopeptidase